MPEINYSCKKMKHLLWVDDRRSPYEADLSSISPIAPPFEVYWAQCYEAAIVYLEIQWPDAVCLDHDLGGEKTGYDIAKHIVDRCMDEELPLPAYASQSDNPPGRENILRLLDNYQRFTVKSSDD